jgi:hypothetical protein
LNRHYVEFKLPDSDKMTLSFRNESLLNDFLRGKNKECKIISIYKDDSMSTNDIKELMSNSLHYTKPSKSERRSVI